ncbi:MAG: RDD family protein [Verrucomicrobia bacterium]|nr:RDD family protein [Verrucomicrobiota bacterium]
MTVLIKSVLLCVLVCLAFSQTRGESTAPSRVTRIYFTLRSLRGAQLVVEALVQHSLLRIQADASPDSEIVDDDHAAKKSHEHGKGGAETVVTGGSYRLESGRSTSGSVILIGGTGAVDGTVNGDLVLIGSKATLAGTVNGDFVTIGSNLTIRTGAVANGDYFSVASEVKGEQELAVNGERVTLNTYSPAVPIFKEMLTNIVQLRPMSPFSLFSWVLAVVMLIVCLVLGLVFPKVIVQTESIIRERAGPSLFTGLALVLGATVLSFLLVITLIGIVALPFLAVALLIIETFGCTSVCSSIGKRIAPKIANRSYSLSMWILLGTAVLWVLYCIPVVGFIAAGVISLLGFGGFAIYLVERYRSSATHPLLTTESGDTRTPQVESPDPPALAIGSPAIASRRARFLPRLFANVIDLTVLYAMVYSLHLHHSLLLIWVLYRFGMSAWKSATLGQIVLHLQVQKSDGSTLVKNYSAALIRALASLLSLIPLGLGFIWILFDPDLEAWHDKISETYVVQLSPSATRSATPTALKSQEPKGSHDFGPSSE